MLKSIAIAFSLSIAACQPRQTTITGSPGDTMINNDEAIIRAFQRDDQAKMEAIKEPDIQKYNREVFRFRYWIPYGDELIIRAERLEDSTFLLTAKLYNRVPSHLSYPHSTIPLQTFPVHYTEDPTRDSAGCYHVEQILSKKDWAAFRYLIDGSYYWAFEEPFKGSSFFDPQSICMESKSILPGFVSEGELYYHKNIVTAPIKGSYTEAFQFLEKKSILAKKLGFPTFAPMFRWNHKKNKS